MLSEEMADEFLDTWQTKGMVQNAVCRGDEMIKNEMELAVTRERLAKMERFLEELRKTARPESGQRSVLDIAWRWRGCRGRSWISWISWPHLYLLVVLSHR